MKKKLVSVLLIAVMALSLLSGCSGKKNNEVSKTDNTTPTEAAATDGTAEPTDSNADKKPVTLTIWQNPSDETETDRTLRKQFIEKFPYITLDVVQTPENSDILSAMAAGNAPSICINGYPQFKTLSYQGAYLPLDDYVKDWADWSNFDPVQIESFTVNGSVYGIPGGKYALGIAYNKRHFEAAGITETPKTWDEFLEVAKKLTIPDKQQYGFALDIAQWGGWLFEVWGWGAGGEFSTADADGKLTLTFTDPKIVEAGEFVRKLITEKVIEPDLNAKIDDLNNDFATGKASMIIGGLADVSGPVSRGMKAEDIGWFNVPAGPSGVGYNLAGGDGTGIIYTEDKDVADAAWEYLKFTSSKEAKYMLLDERLSKGPVSPFIPNRTDLDLTKYNIDPELQKVLEEGAKYTRDEYYGKGATGSFLDDAVAMFGGDSTIDIKAALQDAQNKAQSAVDEFNDSLAK